MTDTRVHISLPESPRYSLLKGRREQARLTLDRSYANMSPRYIDLKFAALEENVAISARLVNSTTALQRWKMVLTHGPYRRPAITALGIGIFQQLCGFNTLSEYPRDGQNHRSSGLTNSTVQCTTRPPSSLWLGSTTPLRPVSSSPVLTSSGPSSPCSCSTELASEGSYYALNLVCARVLPLPLSPSPK